MPDDWRTSTDPDWMLWRLRDRTSARKCRLLALAFCQSIRRLMTRPRCRKMIAEAQRLSVFGGQPAPCKPAVLLQALDDLERCADGLASAADLARDLEVVERISWYTAEYYFACYDPCWGVVDHRLIATCEAGMAVYHATRVVPDLKQVAAHAAWAVYRDKGGEEQKVADPKEEGRQCDAIRDLFVEDLRTAAFAPAWSSETVLALATGIYAERAFDRLPILADSLEEAGCDHPDILAHCRGPGPHVRGCWVVDLVLGKG